MNSESEKIYNEVIISSDEGIFELACNYWEPERWVLRQVAEDENVKCSELFYSDNQDYIFRIVRDTVDPDKKIESEVMLDPMFKTMLSVSEDGLIDQDLKNERRLILNHAEYIYQLIMRADIISMDLKDGDGG
jgi:hypothetical protein